MTVLSNDCEFYNGHAPSFLRLDFFDVVIGMQLGLDVVILLTLPPSFL